MRYLVIIFLLLLLPYVYSQWADENFKLRTCINIKERNNSAWINYIYAVLIDTSGLVSSQVIKSDCSDIRVYDNITLLKHYLVGCGEKKTYIFFPLTISTLEEKKICIYLSSPLAVDIKDITIMKFYDDFENLTHHAENNWALSGCSFIYMDTDRVLRCENGYAKVYANITDIYFQIRSNSDLYFNDILIPLSTQFKTYNFLINPGYINWTVIGKGKWFELNNVVGRNKDVNEPTYSVGPLETKGITQTTFRKFCEGNYTVLLQEVCTDVCTVNKTSTYCDYGCYEGECIMPTFKRGLLLIIILIGVLLLVALIIRILRI